MSSRSVNSESVKNGRGTKAKKVTFYRSGDVNFSGCQMAILPKNCRNFETLLDELTRKVALSKGAQRVHTPGGVHTVTSVEALEDGRSYVVTSSKKLKPLNLDSVQKQRVWRPIKKSLPNGVANGAANGAATKVTANGVMKRGAMFKPSPPSKDRTPPRNGYNAAARSTTGKSKLSPTPKKIMVMRNGDYQAKHMMLLNRSTAQSFEDILQAISEMFNLRVQKLCTPDGTKVESLQAIFNGPELFVALPGTERFRALNYLGHSPFKAARPKPRLQPTRYTDETDHPPPKIRSKGKWRVWISTNENPAAGTDATVYMVVYGDRGKTDDIILGAADGYFEAGNEDEFTIQIGDVGEIYKIRIGHDDSTEYAGWKCDEVRMEDVHTGEELVFVCDRWMSRDEEDGDVCRELAVSRGEDTLPAVRYQVLVSTGDYWGAGLDGKVFITLIGERGDSGPRLLYKSDQEKMFQKGKTDMFILEAVSLGSLKGILIGHDSEEPGKGWFLDEVVVREIEADEREFSFPCYQWLDVSMEEGAITQEISVNDTPVDFQSELWEREKWKFATGNQLMLIHGTSGRALHITGRGTVEAGSDPYAKMSTAYFVVENLKNNLCVFSSLSNSGQILAMDGNRPSVQATNSPLCGFNILVQPDGKAVLESNISDQHLSFSAGGKPIDCRVAQGPLQTYYIYTKGMFRTEGIIILYTSRMQTLTIDDCGRCHATGVRSDSALWRVHKVREGGVRMFENLSVPESFLRIKNGACDGKGEGDECCHFKVHKIKSEGYIKLQSVAEPESFVGFTLDGVVIPVVDDGETNLRMYPAVVQVGVPKKRLTPTPPSAPRVANKKKRVRVKKVSVIPEGPPREMQPIEGVTATQSLLEEERSFHEDGDWRVQVKTGTIGTSSDVVLVVYGEDGVSEPMTLGRGEKLFTEGSENDFKVNLSGIGDIYKIRVGLDTVSKKASWRLDQVKMTDLTTGQQLTFRFKNRWLALREDDGSLWREAAAGRPGVKPLPINRYAVQVFTGWEHGSGTDAHVFLTLVGEKGDTGRRLLHRSSDKDIFREGVVSHFEIEAVSVQKLKSVIVEHDGREAGNGWYCREILVKESKDSKSEYIFPCDRWLDEGEDDHLIKREIMLKEKRKIKENDWHVYVTTGSGKGSSLEGPVTLVAYGDRTHSELMLAPPHGRGFAANSVEDFRVNIGDIGRPFKVRIGHRVPPESEHSWYLVSLRFVDVNSGMASDFEVDRWLSPRHDDQDTWREFPVAVEGNRPTAVIKYLINVYTGKEYGSGTRGNVYVHLFGSRSDSGRRQLLRNGRKTFTTGQTDMFVVEAACLGVLQRIVVGHDQEGEGKGWYLEKIVVKESRNLKNEYRFVCQRWLDTGRDDGQIERELVIGQAAAASSCVTSESVETTTETLTVSWLPPATVTGYVVTLNPPDALESRIESGDPKLTQVKFEGLVPGKEYRVDITTLSGDKRGKLVSLRATTDRAQETTEDASEGAKFALPLSDPLERKQDVGAKTNDYEQGEGSTLEAGTAPHLYQVRDPSATSTNSTIHLAWGNPTDSDGLIGYLVSYCAPKGAATNIKIHEPDTMEATIHHLVAGRQYQCEISALYEARSGRSVTLTQRTKPNPPTNVQFSSIETGRLILKWERPLGDLTGYVLSYRPTPTTRGGGKEEPEGDTADQSEAKEILIDAKSEGVELTGLVPGEIYEISLYTQSQGERSDVHTLQQSTKPEMVRDLTLTVSPTSITSAWAPPGAGSFTGYMATCSQGERVVSRDLSPGETSVTFEGLAERETYRVEVFALSGDGVKSEGAVEVVTTVTTQSLPPVKGAKVTPLRDSITVRWQKPDFDALTGYEVSCFQIGKSEDTAGAPNATITDPTGTINGRQSGNGDSGQSEIGKQAEKGNERQVDAAQVTNEIKSQQGGGVAPQRGVYSGHGNHRGTSAERPPKREDNGDSGVSSEADEGKSVLSPPRKGRIVQLPLRAAGVGRLVFTTVVDVEQTEVVIEHLAAGTDYHVEVTTLCEEARSEAVVMETKTESKPPPILSTDHVVTEDEVVITWYTPPLDFTGYKAVCYKMLPMETRRDGHLSFDQSSEATRTMVNVGEKLLGSEATRVAFGQLEGNTPYVVEIFTVHGAIENEAAEIVLRTLKPPKPHQVTDLSWEADESSFAVSWQKHASSEVTGFLVNIVLPSNPSDLVISDPGSPEGVGDGEGTEGVGHAPLVLQRMCQDAETGELVECLVRGEVLDQRRLEADQTSTMFGDLDPGTIYAVHVASLQGDTQSDWVHFVAETMPATDGLFPVVHLGTSCTRDTIQLTWSPPDGSVTGYRIKWSAALPEASDQELPAQGSRGGLEEVRLASNDPGDTAMATDVGHGEIDQSEQTGKIGSNGESGKEHRPSEAEGQPQREGIHQSRVNVVDPRVSGKTGEKEEGSSQAENANHGVEDGRPNEGNEQPPIEGALPGSEEDGGGMDGETEDQAGSGVADVGAEISSYDIQGLAPCTDYLVQVWTLDGDNLSDPVEITARTYGDWTVRVLMCGDSPPNQRASLLMSVIGGTTSDDHLTLTKRDEPLKDSLNIFQVLTNDIDGIYKIRLEVRDVDPMSYQGIHVKQVSMVHNTTAQELLFEGDVWLRRRRTGERVNQPADVEASTSHPPGEHIKGPMATGNGETQSQSGDANIPKKRDSVSGNTDRGQITKSTDAGHLPENVGSTSGVEDVGSVTGGNTEDANVDALPEAGGIDVAGEIPSEMTEDLVAELALVDENLPVLTYKVAVHTDKISETAESWPDAYIIIHGSQGDTGRRQLWMSDQAKSFLPGQIDVFYLQAVEIGSITKVTLGQERGASEKNWKVQRVVVSDHAVPSSQVTFPCDQWISFLEGANVVAERVLEPSTTRVLHDTKEGATTEGGELEEGEGVKSLVGGLDGESAVGLEGNNEGQNGRGGNGEKIEEERQTGKTESGSRREGLDGGIDGGKDVDESGDDGGPAGEITGKSDGEDTAGVYGEGVVTPPADGNGDSKDTEGGEDKDGEQIRGETEKAEGGRNGQRNSSGKEQNETGEEAKETNGGGERMGVQKDLENGAGELGKETDGGRNGGDKEGELERPAGGETPTDEEMGAGVKEENDTGGEKGGVADTKVANGGNSVSKAET